MVAWGEAARSKVDIWNLALDCIGETRAVQAENEERLPAEVCRRHYDNIVRKVFESAAWPFATKQSTISQPSGVSRTGWDYVYTLPSDCAIPLALLNEDERVGLFTAEGRYPFDVQMNDAGTGRLLLCMLDTDEFEVLEYVAYSEYVPGYPSLFVDCVKYGLAQPLAMAIKKDHTLANNMYQLHRQLLSEARMAAFQSRQRDPEPLTESVAVR